MKNKNRIVDFRIKKIYEVEVLLELDDDVEVREVYSKDFPQQFVDHILETDEEKGRGDDGDNWFVSQELPTYEKSYCHEIGVPVWEDFSDDFYDTSLTEEDFEEHKQRGTVFRVSRSDDGLSFSCEKENEEKKMEQIHETPSSTLIN
jgi:hypothetical protein